MGLDIAGVYHQPLEIRVINHRLQQSGPHAPVPPAAEAAVGVLPISVVRGQISPRSAGAQYPAHGVDKPPVVLGRSAPLALSPAKCGLNRSQTSAVISWRRCATVIPPPSTLSPFPAIYHPTAILTTPPNERANGTPNPPEIKCRRCTTALNESEAARLRPPVNAVSLSASGERPGPLRRPQENPDAHCRC